MCNTITLPHCNNIIATLHDSTYPFREKGRNSHLQSHIGCSDFSPSRCTLLSPSPYPSYKQTEQKKNNRNKQTNNNHSGLLFFLFCFFCFCFGFFGFFNVMLLLLFFCFYFFVVFFSMRVKILTIAIQLFYKFDTVANFLVVPHLKEKLATNSYSFCGS